MLLSIQIIDSILLQLKISQATYSLTYKIVLMQESEKIHQSLTKT